MLMNSRLKLFGAVLGLSVSVPASAGQINFVYPAEGASIPNVPKTCIFGNISPSTASLTINGEKVTVYSNGGFIAYLPVSGGDFVFKGELSDGTTAQRKLNVRRPDPLRVSTGALSLELSSYPSDAEVMPGDYIRVSVDGTPGREGVFSLGKLLNDAPLSEIPAGSGKYYGSYKVRREDQGAEFFPSARFKAGLFAHGASDKAKGRVTVLGSPSIVETSTDTVVLRDGPEGGYMMFLPKGVKLVSTGRLNGMRRIALSPSAEGWVEDVKVQPASGAPYPFGPAAETSTIHLKQTGFGCSAAVGIYEKVPFVAEELANGLRVTLYYTNLHTNYVVYDSSDTLVKNVSFRQTGVNTAQIDFETAPGALWGYNISYSTSDKALEVDLRAAPKPSMSRSNPLSGLTIVLDPGHSPKNTSPYDGAIGPMGTFEYQVNMAIARKLNEDLLALGASVQMTRSGDETVALADRPGKAKDLGGDLFISIHNNAIGDGEDPFSQPRGFSIFHYQRHSMDLAAAVHRSYVKNIPLPDEGLRYGDYLVARMTWMPAILVESAYMIFPDQEEMLNSPGFQARLASAITEGVLDFFNAPDKR